MVHSHYNKKLKTFSRELRKDGTPGEAILWSELLRAKQFYNLQFNRQYPIENYIVDFICRKLKLIVELDGYSHNFKTSEDEARDKRLKELGYKVVRIQEKEVLTDMPNVIRVLESYLPDETLIQSP